MDLSRAPSKPRAHSPSIPTAVIQPRVLFPAYQTSSSDDTPTRDLSSADILSACEELDSTVLHSPLDETTHHSSFIHDLLPLGLTGNDIGAALGSAASVVREMLSSDNHRAPLPLTQLVLQVLPLHLGLRLPPSPHPPWPIPVLPLRMSLPRLGNSFGRCSVNLPHCSVSLSAWSPLRLLPSKPVPSRRKWRLTTGRPMSLPVSLAHLAHLVALLLSIALSSTALVTNLLVIFAPLMLLSVLSKPSKARLMSVRSVGLLT